MEAAKGTTIDINVAPKVKCKKCSGTGMKNGTRKKECGRCGGTGTRVHFMRGGFQMAATCDACGGNGVVTPPGSECPSCDGEGVVTEKSTVNVSIPPGVEDGMRMRVAGEGDAPPTGTASDGKNVPKAKRGDLFVHIVVEPHPKFQRQGSDILYTATIPLTTALLGGIVKIPTLDGEVELRVPTGTNTGDRIVMSGMGMKKLQGGRRGGSGDLKIEFKVNMPK
jgi:molecular chaperone DnaJ